VPAADHRSVVWLPEAKRNRQKQIDYIAERNPAAAVRVGDAIGATIGRLAKRPESARAGRVSGTREAFISGTPLIIVYRIEPAAIVILRVLHYRQKWPPE
jgi:toxin ParE1/3/4